MWLRNHVQLYSCIEKKSTKITISIQIASYFNHKFIIKYFLHDGIKFLYYKNHLLELILESQNFHQKICISIDHIYVLLIN
jgi:ACR3 family arsenite efflux pump ArsB